MIVITIWCATPLLLLGQLEPFFNDLMMKYYTPEIGVGMSDWCLSEQVLAFVAFRGFYEYHEPPPSSNACGIVPAHRNGHQNCQQSGHILYLHFVCCRPGSRQGDAEPLVAQWQHPVASGEALVMLHRAMPHVPLQCHRTAIEMACDCDGGAFILCRRLFCLS